MSRRRPPSKKRVRETLLESLFDPREEGPISIVQDMARPEYSELKAVELIREAQRAEADGDPVQYHARVAQAISLLALARIQRSE